MYYIDSFDFGFSHRDYEKKKIFLLQELRLILKIFLELEVLQEFL